MSDDFGSYLKHQRELRGISLEDIALSTKVNVRFLQALEENRFEELPGEVFIKGYIRSYGQAIGSNIDELLAAYMEATGKRESGETSEAPPAKSQPTPEREAAAPSSYPWKAILGFAVALALIAGGGYWVTTQKITAPQKTSSVPEPTPPQEVDNLLPGAPGEPPAAEVSEESGPEEPENIPNSNNSRPDEEPSAASTDPAARKADTLSSEGNLDSNKNTVTVPEKTDIIKHLQDQTVSKPNGSPSQIAPGEQSLTLVIRVNENSWFNLTIDEQRDQDFILPSGGSKTIQAQNTIVMTIGNRRATELTLNQKSLELPESPDNVVRNFIVNAEQLEN